MFVCKNCGAKVSGEVLGSAHRNHCPVCLFSLHLDRIPGDRASGCGGTMEPVGLTFKKGKDGQDGELMLVHKCTRCATLSKNRVAGDDREEAILDLYQGTKLGGSRSVVIGGERVRILDVGDEREIMTQLFGKNYLA